MDSILSHTSNKEDDLYFILGCDELASEEQIICEFKNRARGCHPDKHPDDPNAGEKFSRIQHAKSVLTDKDTRHDYDAWRLSGLTIPYETWRARKNTIQHSMHWATKEKKEPMIMEAPNLSKGEDDWSGWNRQPTNNDVLRQFRNYEI